MAEIGRCCTTSQAPVSPELLALLDPGLLIDGVADVRVFVEYLNYESGKFSKSRNVGYVEMDLLQRVQCR